MTFTLVNFPFPTRCRNLTGWTTVTWLALPSRPDYRDENTELRWARANPLTHEGMSAMRKRAREGKKKKKEK